MKRESVIVTTGSEQGGKGGEGTRAREITGRRKEVGGVGPSSIAKSCETASSDRVIH